jgi:hypothetical protein
MPTLPKPGSAPAHAWTWRCDACGRAIQDTHGYVQFVDPKTGGYPQWGEADERQFHEAYWAYEDKIAAQQADNVTGAPARWALYSAADLIGLPEVERAKIQAYHRACDPHPDRDSYWVGVERIRGKDLLDWCAHLCEKEFFGRAEMMTLIRRYQWGHCAKDGEA